MPNTLPSTPSPWRSWLPAAAVGLGAFLFLSAVTPPTAVTDDTARDLLLVRDCIDLSKCHTMGAPTSVAGFRQGAAWLDLLVLVRLLGGDVEASRRVVLALNALGVAAIFLAARRLMASAALPSALLALAVIVRTGAAENLINPSAAVFPDVVCEIALLLFAFDGRLGSLLAAAFALGVAVNFHISAYALVPAVLALAILGGRAPTLQVMASVALAVAASFSTSADGVRANIFELQRRHWLIPAGVVLLFIGVLSAAGRSRWQTLTPAARSWIVGAHFIGPFAVVGLWLQLVQQHDFSPTYLHPVIGPGAITVCAGLLGAVALLFRGAGGRGPAGALSLATAVLLFVEAQPALARSSTNAPTTFADARREAAALAAAGWTWDRLAGRVQGPACRQMTVGLSVYMPSVGAASAPSDAQLQIVEEGPVSGEKGTNRHLQPIASWMRPDGLVACRVDAKTSSCRPASLPKSKPSDSAEAPLLSDRTWLAVYPFDVSPPFTARYSVPLITVPGETRVIEIAEPAIGSCGWQFTAAEGIAARGPLPSSRVEVRSDGGGPGRLTIERVFGKPGCPTNRYESRYPPCLQESVLRGDLTAGKGGP